MKRWCDMKEAIAWPSAKSRGHLKTVGNNVAVAQRYPLALTGGPTSKIQDRFITGYSTDWIGCRRPGGEILGSLYAFPPRTNQQHMALPAIGLHLARNIEINGVNKENLCTALSQHGHKFGNCKPKVKRHGHASRPIARMYQCRLINRIRRQDCKTRTRRHTEPANNPGKPCYVADMICPAFMSAILFNHCR